MLDPLTPEHARAPSTRQPASRAARRESLTFLSFAGRGWVSWRRIWVSALSAVLWPGAVSLILMGLPWRNEQHYIMPTWFFQLAITAAFWPVCAATSYAVLSLGWRKVVQHTSDGGANISDRVASEVVTQAMLIVIVLAIPATMVIVASPPRDADKFVVWVLPALLAAVWPVLPAEFLPPGDPTV